MSARLLADLARTTDQMFSAAELRERLAAGRPLRIKYGVDCTAPFLHLGHAVNLWMMRRLQEEGHKVVFLLGDVTTAVGDPTGRSATRPVLAPHEIEANARAFVEQVGIVLSTDPEVFEIRRNSEWYSTMDTAGMLGLLSQVTHAQLMARDMFRRRVADGADIAMHELCYPVLQGYDSLALDADLTIVGSDQLFNEMLGRHYQQRAGRRPQVVITTKITPGIDGKAKQSKSLGNFIALTDSPRDKFGKAMSLPDRLVAEYMLVYTTLSEARIAAVARASGVGARDAKLLLAHALVRRYDGEEAADAEREWFLATFADRSLPPDMPTLTVPASVTVLDLVRRARPDLGGNQVRRLVREGGVRLDDAVLDDPQRELPIDDGAVLRVGRRRWLRLVVDA
jgi:tyrosyl-tRNA synthetase